MAALLKSVAPVWLLFVYFILALVLASAARQPLDEFNFHKFSSPLHSNLRGSQGKAAKKAEISNAKIRSLSDSDIAASLDVFIPEYMECAKLAGLQFGLIRNGSVIYQKAFGVADATTGRKVDEETIFGIGSTSKAFTSLLLAQLEKEGKVDLASRVRDSYSGFALYDSFASDTSTFFDILAHRTGVPRHDFALFTNNYTASGLIGALRYLNPSYSFRGLWQYNNFMVGTAGFIAALLDGYGMQDGGWQQMVQKRIFSPLGLSFTKADYASAKNVANKAIPQTWNPTTQAFENMDWDANLSVDTAAPAGSINSNVIDMLKWLSLHLGLFQIPSVDSSVLSRVHTPQAVINMPASVANYMDWIMGHEYALNWAVGNYRGHKRITHDGATMGFYTLAGFLPDDDLAFFATTNTNGGDTASYPISFFAMDLALGLEPLFKNGTDACGFPCNIVPDYPTCPTASSSSSSSARTSTLPPGVSASSSPKSLAALADFVGNYSHPGYGLLQIVLQNNNLLAFHGDYPTLRDVYATGPLVAISGHEDLFLWEIQWSSLVFLHFSRSTSLTNIGVVVSATMVYDEDTHYSIEFTNANFQTGIDTPPSCAYELRSGVVQNVLNGQNGMAGSNGEVATGTLVAIVLSSVFGSLVLALVISYCVAKHVASKAIGHSNGELTTQLIQ